MELIENCITSAFSESLMLAWKRPSRTVLARVLTGKLRARNAHRTAKMPDSRDGGVVKLPQIAARERGPGPARYMLKTLSKYENHEIAKYRNPAYSFGTRPNPIKVFNSPGPCHLPTEGVNRFGMNGSFKYSMLGDGNRAKMTKFVTPGPGRRMFFSSNLWLPASLKCKQLIHWAQNRNSFLLP